MSTLGFFALLTMIGGLGGIRFRILSFVVRFSLTERNFAFTLENNKLLIEQSALALYKKGCFVAQ